LETNQPPQDLFISSIDYLVQLLFISSYDISVPNVSHCIIFSLWVWLRMLLLG